MFGISDIENTLRGIVDIFTKSDFIEKLKEVFEKIKELPQTIYSAITTFGTLVYAGLRDIYFGINNFINFIISGLSEIWDFFKWMYNRIKSLFSYVSNLIHSLISKIWERRIDFISALKASAIAYASYKAIKKKYAGDPLRMFFGILGVEFSQPLIYIFNKRLLYHLTANWTPAYTVTSTGEVLSRRIENYELKDTLEMYDKVEIEVYERPGVAIYDTFTMRDRVEIELVETGQEGTAIISFVG